MLDKDFPVILFDSEELQLVTSGRCVRCPICGKVVCVPDINTWVYKMVNRQGKQRIMCSWTCFRKGEQMIKDARMQRRERYDQYNFDLD